ncbi:PD-(D/E)XK nuclease domain-containing protein [Providencia heimbachae]|uniref:Malate dehydrogenase n=1 Tax=Providencia heimbachae ATCC 35613 TaxID=1354272 RepID=A0A1B7K4W2_9GAMM|nr:hypothetical protein [Providencia heimbachae]OAT55064.1 hypothetical protein M998_0214 [Providencia heimbachae ATCC 35613]SQH13251.1 Uncharacterised protein [Providencia heimbachae]
MENQIKDRFEELTKEIEQIIENKVTEYDYDIQSNVTIVDLKSLNLWKQSVKYLLGEVYGKESDYYKDFYRICRDENRYYSLFDVLTEKLIPIFNSAKSNIHYQYKENNVDNKKYALDRINKICSRFHHVSRQLQARYNDRNTLDIDDEYDVQDLLHSLLKIDFDDIRPEEYSPSYASSSSRVDFLLKEQKIIIEVKKTRKSLKTKEIAEQLIVDIARYNEHPDCELLIFFIYDPDAKISNPMGLIRDLEKSNHKVKIIINPI